MSEIDARPPPTRGRSSYRGGRGGFGRSGPRGGRKPANGTASEATQVEDPFEDQGELGEMKKKYTSELGMLRDMFPDWTDVDLVFALHEADGDVPSTVDKITQGNVSQFAEVKSTKDRARSKVKDAQATTSGTEKSATRSARGRGGFESTRGGRTRGSERGRGSIRGGRGGHTTANGSSKDTGVAPVSTTESTALDDGPNAATGEIGLDNSVQDSIKDAGDGSESAWANVVTSESTPAAASEGMKSSLIPEGGPKKSWASMFASKPVPVPAKKPPTKQAQPADLVSSSEAPVALEQKTEEVKELQPVPPASKPQEMAVMPGNEAPLAPETLPPERPTTSESEELKLLPSKDPLTEENVEHLPDESCPPATQTAASTTGSIDVRNLTPLPGHQTSISRPPMGGFATSAYRATGMPGRSASFQRRVQEQQEAVVMPGHGAVDRAAVQFGSMGLNGEPGLDVDEDREEPETRQAPQHSPPSQPRTSLPPAPRQTLPTQELSEGLPTPKPAPGLPPASQQNQQQMQDATLAPGAMNEPSHMNQNFNQYGRYGQPSMQDSGAQQQKPYDPFGHQAQPSFDQYGPHSQQGPHQQQQSQSNFGGLSSAPNDYSTYYTADQQRNSYNQYYGGSYGPQDVRSQAAQAQQDAGMGQQRSTSGLGTGQNESAFPSQAQHQAQSRFGDAAGSGQNTPNPLMGGAQQAAPAAQQSQQMHQAPNHQQQGGYGAGQAGFPYGHPYYSSPYQQAYQNQFAYSQQVGGYGGYPNKQGGMYGASHGYSIGPQSSYDQHSSSPANAGSFGQNQPSSMRSASGMSGLGGLDDYGRAPVQSTHQQSGGFSGMNDPFARSTSGFGGQSGYGQQNMASQEESLKSFNDNKSGPSPALGQPVRPGSAANNAGSSNQTGLPPPQNQQSSFGGGSGYPGFPGQGQYGGLGGLGTQQHGQNNMGGQAGYGSYGAGGFSQTYGGYGSRGGWGSNYGAH